MLGERCWSGAGCVNSARPVLRGFGGSIGQGSNIVTPPRRNPWRTGNTKRILNPKDPVLLARRTASSLYNWKLHWRSSVTTTVIPFTSAQYATPMLRSIAGLVAVFSLVSTAHTALADSPVVASPKTLSDAEYKDELAELLTKFNADLGELQSRRTETPSKSTDVAKRKFRPDGIRRPTSGFHSTQPAVIISQQRPNAARKWAMHILMADGRSIVLPYDSQFDQQHGTWKFSTDGLSYTWREGGIGGAVRAGAIEIIGDKPHHYRYSSDLGAMSNAIGQPVAGDLFDVIKTWLSYAPESNK